MKTKAGKPATTTNATSNTPFFTPLSELVSSTPAHHEASFFQKTSSPPSIQAKLTLGQPDDPFEKEADAMADHVMRQPTPVAAPPEQMIRRKCKACEEEDQIQRKESEQAPAQDAEDIERQLAASGGKGAPMPADIRMQMEQSFDADFSKVRIHNNSESYRMAKSLGAQAFTHGNNPAIRQYILRRLRTAPSFVVAHSSAFLGRLGASLGGMRSRGSAHAPRRIIRVP